jgi:hypothetical protein
MIQRYLTGRNEAFTSAAPDQRFLEPSCNVVRLLPQATEHSALPPRKPVRHAPNDRKNHIQCITVARNKLRNPAGAATAGTDRPVADRRAQESVGRAQLHG